MLALLLGIVAPLWLAVAATDLCYGDPWYSPVRAALMLWVIPAGSFALTLGGYRTLWRYTVFGRGVGFASVALCAGLALLGLGLALWRRGLGPWAPAGAAGLWLLLTGAAWPGYRRLYDYGDLVWIHRLRAAVSLAASALTSAAVFAASFVVFSVLQTLVAGQTGTISY